MQLIYDALGCKACCWLYMSSMRARHDQLAQAPAVFYNPPVRKVCLIDAIIKHQLDNGTKPETDGLSDGDVYALLFDMILAGKGNPQ